MHAAALYDAVRTGKVNILHCAHAMGATTRHTGAVHSVGIDCNQLSGLDITDKCCSYGVQSTGFAGHNVTIAKTADGQGTETIFVAAGVKRILG